MTSNPVRTVAVLGAGKVGTVLGEGEWFTVTQERLNKFAEATEDRQWIHLDEATRKLAYRGEKDMVRRAQEYVEAKGLSR